MRYFKYIINNWNPLFIEKKILKYSKTDQFNFKIERGLVLCIDF